jgi:transposase
MAKRRYRSAKINKIETSRLLEAIVGDRIVVGVDVAKEDLFASIMDERQHVHAIVRWKHPKQSQQWVDFVVALSGAEHRVEVVMEPSGVYGDGLRWALHQAGVPVFRVNPKRSHDAAEVYDGVPSLHDAKSAAIIAKLHLDGASEAWPIRSNHERKLAAAVRLLEVHKKQFRQNRNRLEGVVSRHWPELSRILDLDSVTLLELLIVFGGPGEVAKRPDEARTVMRQAGGRFLDEAKVDAVIDSASTAFGMAQLDEERRLVQQLAQEARRNQKAMKAQERRVETLTADAPVTQHMRPVVGKVTTAVLVAAVGDPTGYESAYAYSKALGLNLKEKSSGKQQGQLHITKRGPGVARLYLYLAVLRWIQSDVIARAWYDRKVKRQGGRLKSRLDVRGVRREPVETRDDGSEMPRNRSQTRPHRSRGGFETGSLSPPTGRSRPVHYVRRII